MAKSPGRPRVLEYKKTITYPVSLSQEAKDFYKINKGLASYLLMGYFNNQKPRPAEKILLKTY